MLSRFVIAFLPKSRRLLVSWLAGTNLGSAICVSETGPVTESSSFSICKMGFLGPVDLGLLIINTKCPTQYLIHTDRK